MRRASVIACVVAASTSLVAAGCGGGGSDGAQGGGDTETTTLKVGIVPIATVAPVYLGIKHGFFRAQRLRIEPSIAAGGAELVPAVLNNELQVGYTNGVSLLFAAHRNIPITIVANGSGAAAQGREKDIQAKVVVPGDSPIRRPTDLEGKSVAVNELKNVTELTTRAALAKQGVDDSKVKFQEITFPDMLPALQSHRVDAAYLTSPFTQQAEADGYRTLVRPYYDNRPGLVTAYYFMSDAFVAKNPDVAQRFRTAMQQSLRYTIAHMDEARAALKSYTKIPSSIVPKIAFGGFPTEGSVSVSSLKLLSDLMVKYRYVDRVPDVQRLLPDD